MFLTQSDWLDEQSRIMSATEGCGLGNYLPYVGKQPNKGFPTFHELMVDITYA